MSDRESYSDYDDPAPIDAHDEIARLREDAERLDDEGALADLKIKMAGNSRDYEVLLAERDAEIAGLREDAERYYFLRDDFGVSSLSIDGNHAWAYRNFSLRGPTLDAAIDVARKETK